MKTIPDLDRVRWLACKNASGQAIPAYSCVQVSGVNSDGALNVIQPATDAVDVLVTSPQPIQAGGSGLCTRDEPIVAAYDQSYGTPQPGDVWTAKGGTWTLAKIAWTGASFTVLGSGVPGLVTVTRYPLFQQQANGLQLVTGSIAATTTGLVLDWVDGFYGCFITDPPEWIGGAPDRFTIAKAVGVNGAPPYRLFWGNITFSCDLSPGPFIGTGTVTVHLYRNGSAIASFPYTAQQALALNSWGIFFDVPWYLDGIDGSMCQIGDYFQVVLDNNTNYNLTTAGTFNTALCC